MVDQRSFNLWKDIVRRLESVESEEDAIEAAGALRDLLELEGLLLPDKGRRHARTRVNDRPLPVTLQIKGYPDRIIGTTEEAALIVRELLTQRPNPHWNAALRRLEAVRTEQDAAEAIKQLRSILESEDLLVATGETRGS